MATTFTNVGEFRRGKGQRKIRTGPRMRLEATTRPGSGKVIQSPDQIALRKLNKLLDKPGLDRDDRIQSQNKVAGAEQLRFMNMAVLAEVLLFMHDVGHNVTYDNFNYTAILPYVNRLLPRREVIEGGITTKEIPETELEIMRLRMAATFLRYIRFVSLYQAEMAQQIEEATEQMGQQMAPEIEEW
jgi:hypothetical protein